MTKMNQIKASQQAAAHVATIRAEMARLSALVEIYNNRHLILKSEWTDVSELAHIASSLKDTAAGWSA